MEDFSKDFIYLDSLWLKEDKLLQLAFNAGSWDKAEHYLFAYLANAVINGNKEAIKKVNEVRESYGVKPIPNTEGESEKAGQLKKQVNNSAELARKKYSKLGLEDRKAVLKASLSEILELHLDLFKSSTSWNGIYLVIRDRVDGSLKKKEFSGLATMITPEGWPPFLKITKTTLNNFTHYVVYPDSEMSYFNMKNNPWEALCETFWEILELNILTKV